MGPVLAQLVEHLTVVVYISFKDIFGLSNCRWFESGKSEI